MTDWTKRFIDMADLVASWSKDPSTRVGAVIVRPDKTVASVGFNGFPAGMDDSPAAYADREFKLKHIVHAEFNALDHLSASPSGCDIYITHPPCRRCAEDLVVARISRVFFRKPDAALLSRWNIQDSLDYLDKYGIEYHSYDPTRTPPTH